MNQFSLRASSGGGTALFRHCNNRCVFVNVPAFSACPAAGIKNTSVPISAVFNSPRLTSGESYQNDAVSVSTISRTTIHFSFAIRAAPAPNSAPPPPDSVPSRKARPSFRPSCRANNPDANGRRSHAAASEIQTHFPSLLLRRNKPSKNSQYICRNCSTNRFSLLILDINVKRQRLIAKLRHAQISRQNVEQRWNIRRSLNRRMPAQRQNPAARPPHISEQQLQNRGAFE